MAVPKTVLLDLAFGVGGNGGTCLFGSGANRKTAIAVFECEDKTLVYSGRYRLHFPVVSAF
jgi:hypothetical protein